MFVEYYLLNNHIFYFFPSFLLLFFLSLESDFLIKDENLDVALLFLVESIEEEALELSFLVDLTVIDALFFGKTSGTGSSAIEEEEEADTVVGSAVVLTFDIDPVVADFWDLVADLTL